MNSVPGLMQLESFKIALFLLIAGGTVFPGFLFLFVFCKDFFKEAKFSQLVLLSASISAPVLMVGSYLSWFIERLRFKGDMEAIFAASMINGCLLATISFYISILYGFLFHRSKRNVIFFLGVVLVLSDLIYFICWKVSFP